MLPVALEEVMSRRALKCRSDQKSTHEATEDEKEICKMRVDPYA